MAPPDWAGQVVGVEELLEGRGRSRPVVGVGGFLSAEPLDVDCDRGQDMSDVCLRETAVAAAARPVSACELGDGALDTSRLSLRVPITRASWDDVGSWG